jgi:hypothetical protein
VTEGPLSKLGRVLGGVILTQGRLGHQVLGQLLLGNSTDAAIAGASVVVTATTGQQNAVFQVALRTAVPALALAALFARREEQLDRLETILDKRERALDARTTDFARRQTELRARDRAVSKPEPPPLEPAARVDTEAAATMNAEAAARVKVAEAATAKARRMVIALERERHILRKKVVALRGRLAAHGEQPSRIAPPPPADPTPPETPPRRKRRLPPRS